MLTRKEEIERTIITKFRKVIWRPFTKAIRDYELIEKNDKIAVCISGGKDSMLMAKCLEEIQKHGKIPFEIVYLVMDPGYNEENKNKIIENAKTLGINITIFQSDIFEIVDKDEKGSPCYLCARMRRGCLYKKAQELGCNKIALGHHFNDVIETILLSVMYGGEYKSMPPKLKSKNFKEMELIRPMYLVREEDIINWSKYNNLSFINCACRFTEKSSKKIDNSKRLAMKILIKELKKQNPMIEYNIFASSENVNINTVLGIKTENNKENFLDIYKKEK